MIIEILFLIPTPSVLIDNSATVAVYDIYGK